MTDPMQLDDWPAPPSRRRRVLVVLGILAGITVVIGAVAVTWVRAQIDPSGPPGAEIELEIAAGSTTEDIGDFLAEHDVITSPLVWNYWTRLEEVGPFQAGIYVFQLNSSFREAVTVLEAGPRPPESDRVTIPEGLTIVEIAERMTSPGTGIARWDRDRFLGLLASGEIRSIHQPDGQTSMEGLLFPDTYDVADDTDERTFLRRLVTEMDERLASLDVSSRAAELGLTPYEVIVLASLIEEEARVPEEREMISRVIHNRLAQGIPLGIDATSRYEAELAGRSRDDIDFDSDSPYNTRRVQGLPPTPIAAPGMASLRAALHPVEGPWIFYVLQDEEGHHFFTDSAAEFQRAKRECARKGLGCG